MTSLTSPPSHMRTHPHTQTQGIVSRLGGELSAGLLSVKNVIQTDATINRANSGGVLLDSKVGGKLRGHAAGQQGRGRAAGQQGRTLTEPPGY